MKGPHHHAAQYAGFYIVGLAVLVAGLGGALGYTYMQLRAVQEQTASLSQELASTTDALGTTSEGLSSLKTQTSGLSQSLANTKETLVAASDTISGVEQKVGSITGQVTTLQKLANTDPELLKKYSKVYFLNENYVPAQLSTIPQEYVYSNTVPQQFLTQALPFLVSMLQAAKSDGINLYVVSAYRSFGTQASLKSRYDVLYGAGTANAFSADQGYSEHQLGTTADFITTGLGGQLTDAFDRTKAFTWMQQNAYKFGFEMSYPQGNSYYIYEPWHWRFVGVKLATYLHDHNENFYDMNQRQIDTYLVSLFD